MTPAELIMQTAENYQKQMQAHIEEIMQANPDIEYQDAANTFICLKLAELAYRFANS